MSNALSGFSQGFVQSGGASQTAAAQEAGGRSQLATVVAAALIVCTGLFLTGLFTDLPQATLGAIVVVAVWGFINVAEMRRIARLRRSALGLALVALVTFPGTLVVVADGPLWYANVVSVSDRVVALVHERDQRPERVILDLVTSADLDVATIDGIGDLATALGRDGIALSLSAVSRRARARLEAAGLTERVAVAPRLEIALSLEETEPVPEPVRTLSPSRP